MIRRGNRTVALPLSQTAKVRDEAGREIREGSGTGTGERYDPLDSSLMLAGLLLLLSRPYIHTQRCCRRRQPLTRRPILVKCTPQIDLQPAWVNIIRRSRRHYIGPIGHKAGSCMTLTDPRAGQFFGKLSDGDPVGRPSGPTGPTGL